MPLSFQQVGTIMANKCANDIIKNTILHTPSKVGVLQTKTFFHTPDEAKSVGLAKACVLSKNLFCYREISFKTLNFCLFIYIIQEFALPVSSILNIGISCTVLSP